MRVEIWSDVVCPWCYIGKRRFEEGLRRYRDAGGTEPVEIVYRSFELAPDVPVDFAGSAADFLAQHKGLPRGEVDRMLAQVAELAAAEGLEYDWDSVVHANTRKAHQVMQLARAQGRDAELAERLMAAYFTQGRDLNDGAELAALAAEVGLDPAEVGAALAEGALDDAVQADIDQAARYGIGGVPFFVIDSRLGVSGAQAPETFAAALTQADEAAR